jgi:hypothetical protein
VKLSNTAIILYEVIPKAKSHYHKLKTIAKCNREDLLDSQDYKPMNFMMYTCILRK